MCFDEYSILLLPLPLMMGKMEMTSAIVSFGYTVSGDAARGSCSECRIADEFAIVFGVLFGGAETKLEFLSRQRSPQKCNKVHTKH